MSFDLARLRGGHIIGAMAAIVVSVTLCEVESKQSEPLDSAQHHHPFPSSVISTEDRPDIPPQDETELWLTVRLLPEVETETLRDIAAATSPTVVPLAEAANLENLLQAHYGDSAQRMVELVREINPWIDSANPPSRQQVLLPAGPRWSYDVTVFLPKHSTAWEEYLHAVGRTDAVVMDQLSLANPSLADRWTSLQPGEAIKLPLASEMVSLPLRSDDTELAMHFAATLETTAGVAHAEVGPAGFLVPQITEVDLASTGGICPGSAPRGWHYGAVSATRAAASIRPNHPVVVAVIDSGLVREDDRFSPVLWINWNEKDRYEDEDDDHNRCVDDIHGCNMISSGRLGFPADTSFGQYAYHGTHVAGLLTARLAPDLAPLVDDSIELMVIKVANDQGRVLPGTIYDAVSYARSMGARVVNMSLETGSSQAVEDSIQFDEARTLFVAAAGNGINGTGVVLDDESYRFSPLPAVLARDLPNVISVAACDSNLDLASHSNRGPDTVDLAAPGLCIESTVGDGKTAVFSGTSQAAPLVSLTAALLLSQNASLSPQEVKRRILAAVDFHPGLKGKVRSSGVLNMAKALNMSYDLLQTSEGELIAGQVTAPVNLHLQGQNLPVPLQAVTKILFQYAPEDETPARVYFHRRGSIEYRDAQLDSLAITIRLPSGESRTLRGSELVDLVPALRGGSGATRSRTTAG